jgi:lipoprotein-anchoring transpeptidase ErfK/SrfK
MSVVRTLAACYLVSVSAFGLAAGLRVWPGAVDQVARMFDWAAWRPAVTALARAGSILHAEPTSNARVVLALDPPGPADGRTLARVDLPKIERRQLVDMPPPSVDLTLDAPLTIAPDLPAMPMPMPVPHAERRAKGEARVARAETPFQPGQALTPEQMRARAHLASVLTPQMRDHFGLFVFVSKAANGPSAQRAYVFRKEHGALRLLYDWAASTGREKAETSPRGRHTVTDTPAGFYQLDPDRMYRKYRSYNWDQDMPYAMFFNHQRRGLPTGLAIHAATGDDIARLGMRASAGCVHLSPVDARTLFDLVTSEYRGRVPRFSIDSDDTMSTKGRFARKADGSLRMTDGYRVLVDIENYSGGDGSDAVALF